jgi:hypothetical protein
VEGDEGLGGEGWWGGREVRNNYNYLHSNIPEESIKDQSSIRFQTFPIPAAVGEVSVGIHACSGLE